MTTVSIPNLLGYDESPNYLDFKSGNCDALTEHTHIFRKAVDKCGLQGVYVLRDDSSSEQKSVVPVVYVCKVDSDEAAYHIHKIVWNQNIVPFLVVQTNKKVRLYSGFNYDHSDPKAGVLEAAIEYNEVAQRLSNLTSESIDTGLVWRQWGDKVTPEKRVDWNLLSNLQKLDEYLRGDGVDKDTSHALIGKYVYLHYLRGRDILSSRKLKKWGIRPENVFSRNATLKSFWGLIEHLEDWLNGKVFPLGKFESEHLKLVAGTFAGDSPNGQLHLAFEAYDFSYIPIETLSVVYEQFLHISETDEETSRGKKAGAYYTPVPLVNFILAELHEKLPLTAGMKVLDPSCGSGAFLVQCYRHLIESHIATQSDSRVRPVILRELLENNIFGVDRDPDACRVAELSLILTLLDYVRPPDLESFPQFKLPNLQNQNIFQADFFVDNTSWTAFANGKKFDWIVGNPPWIELSSNDISELDAPIWNWMHVNSKSYPVGGNQTAEAFAWKATEHILPNGAIGLLMPSMTLFKNESSRFRKKLFRQTQVWCIANFANMAYVLFAGRAEVPAAAFFCKIRNTLQNEGDSIDLGHEKITTYSPLVANQVANKPSRSSKRKETWNIVINADEIREIPTADVIGGEMLPWKYAMWGSHHYHKMFQRMKCNFEVFGKFAGKHGLKDSKGLELRKSSSQDAKEYLPELTDKFRIDSNKLRNCGRIFSFPTNSLTKIPEDMSYIRTRGGKNGLTVSRPPHVILDAARRFAIYFDEFLAVSPSQIGISGNTSQETLLRALALYLSSNFVLCHQFFMSSQWGIHVSAANVTTLRKLPVPLDNLRKSDLNRWANLYSSLVKIWDKINGFNNSEAKFGLLNELNNEVNSALKLNETEKYLVDDFVNIKMKLIKGKVEKDALAVPNKQICQDYLLLLKNKLDNFIIGQKSIYHEIVAVHDDTSAMISIDLKHNINPKPAIFKADQKEACEFDKIRQNLLKEHSQWFYFNRGLRIYNGTQTFFFKPMQKISWSKSQALVDAGEIIAETICGGE